MNPRARNRLPVVAGATLGLGLTLGAASVWYTLNADRLAAAARAVDRPVLSGVWIAPNYCLCNGSAGTVVLGHSDDERSFIDGLPWSIGRILSRGRHTILEIGASDWLVVRDDSVLSRQTSKDSLAAYVGITAAEIDSSWLTPAQWLALHP